jgi:hypothetical protein
MEEQVPQKGRKKGLTSSDESGESSEVVRGGGEEEGVGKAQV